MNIKPLLLTALIGSLMVAPVTAESAQNSGRFLSISKSQVTAEAESIDGLGLTYAAFRRGGHWGFITNHEPLQVRWL